MYQEYLKPHWKYRWLLVDQRGTAEVFATRDIERNGKPKSPRGARRPKTVEHRRRRAQTAED